jgi:hypothetical protein
MKAGAVAPHGYIGAFRKDCIEMRGDYRAGLGNDSRAFADNIPLLVKANSLETNRFKPLGD